MTNAIRCCLFFCCVALIAIGCDDQNANTTAAAKRVDPASVTGPGVIRGKVVFVGTPPTMKPIRNEPCHAGAKPIMDESVVVSSSGGMKNVIVHLLVAPAVDGASLPAVILDQANCQYVPHVVAIVAGQTLTARSSDPTPHNVHFQSERNRALNLSFMSNGESQDVRFNEAEIIRVKCDVHPWMTSYVGVFDTQFIDVTDGDGAFELKQIPAGTYTLAAWHEQLGQIKQIVEVKDATPVEVKVDFTPPG